MPVVIKASSVISHDASADRIRSHILDLPFLVERLVWADSEHDGLQLGKLAEVIASTGSPELQRLVSGLWG